MISTHVLDTARGRPAAGIAVRLEQAGPGSGSHYTLIGEGTTDADGRVGELVPEGAALAAGRYRLRFDTASYLGEDAFFPQVAIAFAVARPEEHHHVPLLLSPYGYTTYRGS
jgi:5-hydroxyisourate hydrolase